MKMIIGQVNAISVSNRGIALVKVTVMVLMLAFCVLVIVAINVACWGEVVEALNVVTIK